MTSYLITYQYTYYIDNWYNMFNTPPIILTKSATNVFQLM